ncbi:zinc-ribbon domain-containing protein [Evansella cellulosilytica]|uniref:Zinc-ribbon domain-containing protein n=1 Tax=Evansella cellulosilytica (strain ATCC 21833 / DSM 2522 / FERM P-1141 / JCM 9156 / N-4) TaxID=649639 RepID=E6TT58_EVAC2|nr:zinc-ribbon domain-containing protein [Evansella cellulosilytica]ADU31966.1 hypothetical protein Bcell_3726 [Evansella cellulosilytica DSM 2522]
MYCHNCGEQLPEDSQFCANCGTKLAHDEHPVDDQTSEQNNEVELKEEGETSSSQNVDETPDTPNDTPSGVLSSVPAATDASKDTVDSQSKEVVPAEEQQNEVASTSEQQSVQETEPIPQESKTRSKPASRKTFSFWLSILVPIFSFFLIVGGLILYYFYESNVNERVLNLKESAEESALDGDFTAAIEDINKAIDLRPNYIVLRQNLQEINQANDFSNRLVEISTLIDEQSYDEADELLLTFISSLDREEGILFDYFKDQIPSLQSAIAVGKIMLELDELTTIHALSDRLNTISSLSSDEAEEVRERIISKIIELSTEQATASLNNNQYSEALSLVNQGLEYASNNDSLLSLRSQIESEQAEFERAEQERLTAALEAAAQDDLFNRTEAVQVTYFDSYIDSWGDIFLEGEIVNNASVPIYDITIYYTVYDDYGYYMDESYTFVFPYYLYPGDIGYFDDWYINYSWYDEIGSVEVDYITWNLD